MWRFTEHIQKRMIERRISKNEILQILHGEVPALIFASDKHPTVDLYFGHVNEKWILIPVDREIYTLITVRPMKKKEIAEFKRQVEDEKNN